MDRSWAAVPLVERIVDLQMDELRQRLAERRITLELTEPARKYIAERGFDPVYGARPLRRYISHEVETRIGLINWLIQDPGNAAVAEEQAFVTMMAETEPAQKRKLMVDLYKRVIDGVVDLGFPLSIHLEAAYGASAPAFETFAEMLDYWSPDKG